MRNDPNMRTVNVDWGERVPKLHFVLDQERLQLIGLSPEAAAQQLQFLLNGQTITQVREDIRAVNIVARSAGPAIRSSQAGNRPAPSPGQLKRRRGGMPSQR